MGHEIPSQDPRPPPLLKGLANDDQGAGRSTASPLPGRCLLSGDDGTAATLKRHGDQWQTCKATCIIKLSLLLNRSGENLASTTVWQDNEYRNSRWSVSTKSHCVRKAIGMTSASERQQLGVHVVFLRQPLPPSPPQLARIKTKEREEQDCRTRGVGACTIPPK